MNKTTAPTKTPSPARDRSQPEAAVGTNKNPRTEFFAAALNMTWQLALVVLIPIIGGFELDKRLNTLPGLTMVGFVIAMVGMALVVWRQLQIFSPPLPLPTSSHTPKGHHS